MQTSELGSGMVVAPAASQKTDERCDVRVAQKAIVVNVAVVELPSRHRRKECFFVSTYTDPRLLDVAGTLEVLPSLPLGDEPHAQRAKATGTGPRMLVPLLVPTPGNHSPNRATIEITIGSSIRVKPARSLCDPVAGRTEQANGLS